MLALPLRPSIPSPFPTNPCGEFTLVLLGCHWRVQLCYCPIHQIIWLCWVSVMHQKELCFTCWCLDWRPLCKYSTGGKCIPILQMLTYIILSIFDTVLLNFSTNPLHCRWHGIECWRVIYNSLFTSSISSEQKLLPLSVRNFSGIPCLHMTCSTNTLATVSLDVSASGYAFGNLVK